MRRQNQEKMPAVGWLVIVLMSTVLALSLAGHLDWLERFMP